MNRITVLLGVFVLSGLLFSISFLNAQSSTSQTSSDYFPPLNGEWGKITPGESGWDVAALKEALDYAQQQKSSGLLIVYKGKILTEEYWSTKAEMKDVGYKELVNGKTKDGRIKEDVASIQKSVVSLLIGKASIKGLIDIDKPVSYYLEEGWSNSNKANEEIITVKQLLSMTSGLNGRLYYKDPPGKEWTYNTTAYSKLIEILEIVTKKPIKKLTKEWLTDPIGIIDSQWGKRPFGFDNPHGFMATHRDMARIGLLVLHKGIWNGKDIIQNQGYLKDAISPSQSMNLKYGYLFWLNTDHLWHQKYPEDMFIMVGYLNRLVIVIPSYDMVIVRFGNDPERGFNTKLLNKLIAAMPKELVTDQ